MTPMAQHANLLHSADMRFSSSQSHVGCAMRDGKEHWRRVLAQALSTTALTKPNYMLVDTSGMCLGVVKQGT